MKVRIALGILVICMLVLSACSISGVPKINKGPGDGAENPGEVSPPPVEDTSSLEGCNEAGKVMILMYHQIVSEETNEWTRSFESFRSDLQTLYDKGYRPISLREYIVGNIAVPKGCTPVIFTFDDGTKGQFNLVKKDGSLIASPSSVVGIMEEFNKTHSDFALCGTFFINHTGFFGGEGTPQERLKYLVDKGFEIGNHTVSHANLGKLGSALGVSKEIGGHVVKTQEYLPGYVVDTLALPLGITSKSFPEQVVKGEYNGVRYENKAVLLVGSNPALSPVCRGIDFLRLPRIRAMGVKPVLNDMSYWLDYFDKHPEERYISDGDANTFVIPEKDKEKINPERYKGKAVVYIGEK